jgi:hypothetical protein
MRSAYDIDGDAFVLVRPDGYIGQFVSVATLEDLVNYLPLKLPFGEQCAGSA